MQIYSGSLVLLKIKGAQGFQVIGGMRTTRFILNNQMVDVSTKESGRWRQLLAGAGLASVVISGAGIFTDQESERLLRDLAFTNKIGDFQLAFGNGDSLRGGFIISAYERSGAMQEEEIYNLTLESAGAVHYEEGVRGVMCKAKS